MILSADTTVDSAEIARFSALADEWWDPKGSLGPLHKLNPTRLAYIRDRIAARFARDVKARRPLAGLSVLDVGCGGGLAAEPLARLGASVTAIDASNAAVDAARAHAAESELAIDYRCAAAGDLAADGAQFDVVLALEIIEHVADTGQFLADCAALVRPGGLLIVATLNRTPQSFALAIIGAEYVLRWAARGTHDWRKFVRPSELAAGMRRQGLELLDLTGVVYAPLADAWRLSRNLSVNYMACAAKN
jgi:2-polyprenyl-6-hydroxyphenyl methylase/3-demethylubiquinone-9 3-methyltransferase